MNLWGALTVVGDNDGGVTESEKFMSLCMKLLVKSFIQLIKK